MMYGIITIKIIGCFAYYWIYFCYYPNGQSGDSGSTMQDAGIMYSALDTSVLDYVRMVFGLHSNSLTDPLHMKYFELIGKWGRADITSDYFLNDNRTPIRINAIIMLFSFGNYAVHALVMLIISFIGQLAIYKTLKRFFYQKELLLAIAIFLLPNVLFWTSGVLKEPFAFFALGIYIYTFFKLFIDKTYSLKYLILIVLSMGLFLIIKPYIFILFTLPLILFTLVQRFQIKRMVLFYVVSISLLGFTGIASLKLFFNRDIIQTIVIRQNDFVNLSEGGIYLLNNHFVKRLDYKDSLNYERVDAEKGLYRIKPHAKLMCWRLENMRDTFYIKDNNDTSLYTIYTVCPPARSTLNMGRLDKTVPSFAAMVPKALYVVALKPLFFDAKSILELLASFENLFIVLIFGLCFYYRDKHFSNYNFLIFCCTLVITSFLLVGFTTTVLGAIVRYKIPFLPFFVMIPLLFLNTEQLTKLPIIKRFITPKS